MADFVFNIAKGAVAEKARDGATLELLLLQAADTDAVLKDFDTVSALLGNVSTTEATFTNYARKTLATVTVTVDDTGDVTNVDCADVVFTAAGGATNNTIVKAVIYEEVLAGDDLQAIPLVCLDASFTTNGNDVTLQIHSSGFFGAS